MKTLIWLDDIRDPNFSDWLLQYAPEFYYEKNKGTHQVVWATDYHSFIEAVDRHQNTITHLSFDHDINSYNENGEELTGYNALKKVLDILPIDIVKRTRFTIHSANPVGRDNMLCYLENFYKHHFL